MNGQPFRNPHVLVVEDDSSTAFTIFYALQNQLPTSSTIRLAYNLADAREWIDREKFNAVLIDFALPDGTGMDLIETLMGNPVRLRPCLFLTSGIDPDRFEVATILSKYPEITFVEKPFRFEALADLIMDRVLPQSLDDQDYYGLQLFDLIQAYSIARRSVTLRILTAEGKMGVISMERGEILHAVMDGVEGIDALRKLAKNRRGKIRLDRGCTTARRTVHDSTQHALLETYRLLDEEEGREVAATPAEAGFAAESVPSSPQEEIEALFKEAFHPEQC